MKTRLEAIVAHWASVARFWGGTDAKRYRGNLKRASTAASDTAKLFSSFEGEGRRLVAEDVETLRKAATLLAQLADDFEVAQRKADRIKADAEAKAKAEHAEQVRQVLVELFGVVPKDETVPADADHPVLSMARDLALFDRAGADEVAKGKGCERGLLQGSSNIGNLKWHADRGHVGECAKIIAENRIDGAYPGRGHVDRYDVRWYHACWKDFMEWRKVRLQVRAACQAPGQDE